MALTTGDAAVAEKHHPSDRAKESSAGGSRGCRNEVQNQINDYKNGCAQRSSAGIGDGAHRTTLEITSPYKDAAPRTESRSDVPGASRDAQAGQTTGDGTGSKAQRPAGEAGAQRPAGEAGAQRPAGEAGAQRPAGEAGAQRPAAEATSARDSTTPRPEGKTENQATQDERKDEKPAQKDSHSFSSWLPDLQIEERLGAVGKTIAKIADKVIPSRQEVAEDAKLFGLGVVHSVVEQPINKGIEVLNHFTHGNLAQVNLTDAKQHENTVFFKLGQIAGEVGTLVAMPEGTIAKGVAFAAYGIAHGEKIDPNASHGEYLRKLAGDAAEGGAGAVAGKYFVEGYRALTVAPEAGLIAKGIQKFGEKAWGGTVTGMAGETARSLAEKGEAPEVVKLMEKGPLLKAGKLVGEYLASKSSANTPTPEGKASDIPAGHSVRVASIDGAAGVNLVREEVQKPNPETTLVTRSAGNGHDRQHEPQSQGPGSADRIGHSEAGKTEREPAHTDPRNSRAASEYAQTGARGTSAGDRHAQAEDRHAPAGDRHTHADGPRARVHSRHGGNH